MSTLSGTLYTFVVTPPAMKNLRLGPLGGQSYLQEGARVFLRTGAATTPLGRTEALVLVVLVLLFLVLYGRIRLGSRCACPICPLPRACPMRVL